MIVAVIMASRCMLMVMIVTVCVAVIMCMTMRVSVSTGVIMRVVARVIMLMFFNRMLMIAMVVTFAIVLWCLGSHKTH